MFELFTRDLRRAVMDAHAEARALGADAIGSEHLVIALGDALAWVFAGPVDWPVAVFQVPALRGLVLGRSDPSPPVTREKLRRLARESDPDAEALATLGISLADVRRRVEEAFGPDAWTDDAVASRLRFRDDAKQALEQALREAIELRTRRVTSMHLAIALLRCPGPARELLERLGVSPDDAYDRARASLERMFRIATR